jgi:hypothetical protein
MKPVTRLRKELKQLESLHVDVKQCIDKNWDTYLGEPIHRYITSISIELFRLRKRIKELENNN